MTSVFCFFEVLSVSSSGGRFLVWGAPLCVGGLWGSWVCGVLSRGLGAAILAFFGERTIVAGCGGCSEWSGVGRLVGGRQLCVGTLRSVRASLGGVVRGRSLGVVYLGYRGGVGCFGA